MRGHDELIAMRIRGKHPKAVNICDFPVKLDAECPTVCVAEDHVVDLDLRFVFDMIVHIDGHDEARADELMQKCIDADARIVSRSCYPKTYQGRVPLTHKFFAK
jgi:DNA-binding Lrp family transcriptional regulator